MLKYFGVIAMALLPWMGFGDIVVTNSTELLRYLGYGGKAGIRFDIDATVVWGTTINSKTFYAKTSDGYVRLADKKLWPNKFLNNEDFLQGGNHQRLAEPTRTGEKKKIVHLV